jgi:hypothetical protein
MKIEMKNKGFFFYISNNFDKNHLLEVFHNNYSYKQHRYIYIKYIGQEAQTKIFGLLKKLKNNSVIIIFETAFFKNIDFFKNLYASGADLIVISAMEIGDSNLKELEKVLPKDILYIKNNESDIETHKKIFHKMPFLLEESVFEPLKRKIWIDLTNLKRKLRIKEVYESFDSSGL